MQRNETLYVQEPVNDICNAFQVPSEEITSAPALLSLPHTSTSSRRATVNDRVSEIPVLITDIIVPLL